jgi:hypothetical protein
MVQEVDSVIVPEKVGMNAPLKSSPLAGCFDDLVSSLFREVFALARPKQAVVPP